MEYKFLTADIDKDNIKLPESDKINKFLLDNNYAEIVKALDFFDSEEKFLYIHGFMGTGKRQFVNYISEFMNNDVIKLEYHCSPATVCDDILLALSDYIDTLSISKAINLNVKITTLGVKFSKQISSIKKPFLIILHGLDSVLDENIEPIKKYFSNTIKEDNLKMIVTTKALIPDLIEGRESDRKIFLKGFSKEIFCNFMKTNGVEASDKQLEDFFDITRGYYFYSAISVKILQAMNIKLSDFIQKYKQSGTGFDSFLGTTYINLIPNTIRNFFWFLQALRHGITLNALAIFDIYDEFSIDYLKSNLIIFQSGETIYLQEYFSKQEDLPLPPNVEIKLHKYIIGIYEAQVKEPLKSRCIMLSRQAMRNEINYHQNCISEIENRGKDTETAENKKIDSNTDINKKTSPAKEAEETISTKMKKASELFTNKKYTDAIECYKEIIDNENIDLSSLVECRLQLGRLYKQIADYKTASHYYELAETYYKSHNELINLNYLYYELTDLYYKMYKNERAVNTAKKVIYSVDTPQSLMVSACTLLGNIYSDLDNPEEAYTYYEKALESLDENVDNNTLAELYFKFALSNDDKEDYEKAFDYYNKCIDIVINNNPYKALCYSNLASCYYERGNYDDALDCFLKAYNIEKDNNNYDGIYYTATHIAKIYRQIDSGKAHDYLIEAQKSAEFLNEQFYIMESSIELGDYYYDNNKTLPDALKEYFKAKNIIENSNLSIDKSKLEQRIEDMRQRMPKEEFEKIEKKYGNSN